MKKLIKLIFGKSKLFNCISWAYDKYLAEQATLYKPEQFKKCGQGVSIAKGVKINMPERMILGDNVFINRGTNINSVGGLYIGSNSGLGINCTIFTWEHRYLYADKIPFDEIAELKPVIIRDFVYIGANVKIMPGVEIGEGAVVGMGSVVTKNVPPLAIVMGNPAQIVFYRDKERFLKCKNEKKFGPLRLVGQYKENIAPIIKKRYEKELKELGMI
ncbi:MAG: acyltransferase [FCB group bacterium]|nr:acyltransferase [FCB group bacterium]